MQFCTKFSGACPWKSLFVTERTFMIKKKERENIRVSIISYFNRCGTLHQLFTFKLRWEINRFYNTYAKRDKSRKFSCKLIKTPNVSLSRYICFWGAEYYLPYIQGQSEWVLGYLADTLRLQIEDTARKNLTRLKRASISGLELQQA